MSEQETVQQYVTDEQVDKLRDAVYEVNKGKNIGRIKRDDVIVSIGYDCGFRVAELLAIKTDGMLRLSQNEIMLPSKIQKDYPNENSPSPATLSLGESHINITRLLRDYLNSDWYNKRDTDYLIPTRQSDKATPVTVNNVLGRLADEAEVRPYRTDGTRGEPSSLTYHDLRHSVANWMLQDSENRLIDVRNRLRHSSIITTEQRYEHFQRR